MGHTRYNPCAEWGVPGIALTRRRACLVARPRSRLRYHEVASAASRDPHREATDGFRSNYLIPTHPRASISKAPSRERNLGIQRWPIGGSEGGGVLGRPSRGPPSHTATFGGKPRWTIFLTWLAPWVRPALQEHAACNRCSLAPQPTHPRIHNTFMSTDGSAPPCNDLPCTPRPLVEGGGGDSKGGARGAKPPATRL